MNSAFIGEKEFCRSQLVLSTEADWTPSSNCIILYIRWQPHSLVNNCLILSQLRQWFLSYLSNRSQRVALQGTYSYWLQVTSWVPQGLMLGLAHYSFSPISMIFPNASNMTKIRKNQGLSKCYQPIREPNAKADNTHWDLDILGYHKNWI